ncbi:MAG: MBL fold metallo-hydrolase, partial [Marinilabiliales bacterium]|nr:MBL fold metallo-hydrolase [Marinilabiliales bacterium]
MIQIKRFTFNPVSVNAYLLWDETGEAVLIDPACNDADEEDELDYFVDRQGLKRVHLLNTHGHFDHLMGNRFAESKWNLTCQIHPAEASLVARACQQAALFGIQMSDPGDP